MGSSQCTWFFALLLTRAFSAPTSASVFLFPTHLHACRYGQPTFTLCAQEASVPFLLLDYPATISETTWVQGSTAPTQVAMLIHFPFSLCSGIRMW
jgi:hypothetical protein